METGSTVRARMAPKARLLQIAVVGSRAACSPGLPALPGAIGIIAINNYCNVTTTDESVPENALAGTIPTEIGQLAELRGGVPAMFFLHGKRVYHLRFCA